MELATLLVNLVKAGRDQLVRVGTACHRLRFSLQIFRCLVQTSSRDFLDFRDLNRCLSLF